MPPLPKILTLAGILMLLFPPASPGKATEWPEKSIITLFYGVIAWSLLGAPNWLQAKVSLPEISLPKFDQGSSFTTAPTTTPMTSTAFVSTPVVGTAVASTPQTATSGVLVRCPSNLQVVNIRQTAGLTAVLAQVRCGDRVNVLAADRPVSNGETWVPVEHKRVKGWVTARYLAL